MDEIRWVDDVELMIIVDPFNGTWWRVGGQLTGYDLAITQDLFDRHARGLEP